MFHDFTTYKAKHGFNSQQIKQKQVPCPTSCQIIKSHNPIDH